MTIATLLENENAAKADQYMSERLCGLYIYDRIIKNKNQNDGALLYEILDSPKLTFTDYSRGRLACRSEAVSWLAQEIYNHIHESMDNLCIIEDLCGSPTDPIVFTDETRPLWTFGGRLFWPISSQNGDLNQIRHTLAWALIARIQLICFCKMPYSLSQISDNYSLSESDLCDISNSTTKIVTDAYDQEGFVLKVSPVKADFIAEDGESLGGSCQS